MQDYSSVEGEETEDGGIILYASNNDDAWIESDVVEDLSWSR